MVMNQQQLTEAVKEAARVYVWVDPYPNKDGYGHYFRVHKSDFLHGIKHLFGDENDTLIVSIGGKDADGGQAIYIDPTG